MSDTRYEGEILSWYDVRVIRRQKHLVVPCLLIDCCMTREQSFPPDEGHISQLM